MKERAETKSRFLFTREQLTNNYKEAPYGLYGAFFRSEGGIYVCRQCKIYIRSGKGGDGHVSFRRELFVAAGGPDGGDGGRGGDVIFEVDDGLNTLTDFRHVRKYVAGDGEQGGKRRCHGADGEDLIVKVPEGTVIKDFESGKVIADMSGENRREVILKGGKGGLGNMHFATSTMQVPKYAQPGQPAQELWVQLELKVIADVGLVGFPNVGKSTLLSRVSNARPKIANYHFTTLNPHLGVVDLQDGQGFVMADIPGSSRVLPRESVWDMISCAISREPRFSFMLWMRHRRGT